MHSDGDQDLKIDEDLDEEEFHKLVLEAQQEALQKEREERLIGEKKKPAPFVKWIVWVIAFALVFNALSIFFKIYSIPAVEFLKVSTRLSAQENIQTYKKSVAEVSTGESKGTGFAISSDGLVLTNEHVIDDALSLTVIFPDDGIYGAEVVESFPEIDLAILQLKGDNIDIPYLQLAESFTFEKDDHVYFIGNPLYFTGIANEGTLLDYKQLRDWEEQVMMMQAPVYRGNSGSPVINKDGHVIGVVFATIKDELHGHVGLFVPIDAYYRALHNEQ